MIFFLADCPYSFQIDGSANYMHFLLKFDPTNDGSSDRPVVSAYRMRPADSFSGAAIESVVSSQALPTELNGDSDMKIKDMLSSLPRISQIQLQSIGKDIERLQLEALEALIGMV